MITFTEDFLMNYLKDLYEDSQLQDIVNLPLYKKYINEYSIRLHNIPSDRTTILRDAQTLKYCLDNNLVEQIIVDDIVEYSIRSL
jgi:hypothetical protein